MMELWFILTVGSAVFAGVSFFFQKVVAERGYDAVLVNMYGALLSAIILAVVTLTFADFSGWSWYLILLVTLSGGLYALNGFMRVEALRCIDTAIYLPLYKTFGPMVAIILGVVIFEERFTTFEWLGLLVSLLVPLLLISRVEKLRQRNLVRGLWWLLITAVLSAFISMVDKLGAVTFANILLFATLADFAGALAGMLMYGYRKGLRHFKREIVEETSSALLLLAVAAGTVQAASYGMVIFAYALGGPFGIVYTVHSLYILIPIVLAAIVYHEHWNVRKVLAIMLSIAALWLLQ